MTEPEDLEEDLFADLYDADDSANHAPPAAAAPAPANPAPAAPEPTDQPSAPVITPSVENIQTEQFDPSTIHQSLENGNNQAMTDVWDNGQGNDGGAMGMKPEAQGTGIKEDGKMFIGGLNWETTDQSLKDYFSQFGEVQECTVMRDGTTGRSRGFGFLTFRDPKTVNTVMVKEHYLDGKIIDPKRAIPRDEQERTSKIFVGGVSQEATEQDFMQFFMQFGRVIDATLMIDKDTGRPRGFGFVTFDSEAAVDATLSGPLEIHGKPIEVKKAQPRGGNREEDGGRGGGRRGGGGNDRFNGGAQSGGPDGGQQQHGAQGQGGGMSTSGMTPQMMAQYWQRMQQYFAMMQQQMAAASGQGMGGGGNMSPAMMQQMQQMKQMQQMQAGMGGGGQPQQAGGMSPHPQSPGSQGMQGMMNPAMMQQMQQMQQMQNQGQGGAGYGGGMGGPQAMGGNMGGPMAGGGMPGGGGSGPAPGSAGGSAGGGGGGGPGSGNFTGNRGGPGYNAQEQLAFEQQKYEQQQARRAAVDTRNFSPYQQGGPTSWEGMYDDVPQPNVPPSGPQGGGMAGRGGGPPGGGGGPMMGRGMSPQNFGGGPGHKSNPGSKGQTPQPQGSAPANAPTGPRNAGRPGANYRGGGRGGHRGFHPYART
ncbi:hypothetical protein FQN54_000981 [Arachnomyces sp. PD_36]|nr:hypothetical protein FQN54_000981 [Arachnomyces sp. PD_36]